MGLSDVEIWVNPATDRIMAIYDPGRYTGNVWQGLGYERYDKIEPWMKLKEQPAPEPLGPTVIIGEGGKEYVVGSDGKLKVKAVVVPI